MVDIKKYKDKDLYGLLGIDISATEQEIRKAYRKKALACHPDKNPDNPKAAELFHELSTVLEILVDTAARGAYDKILNAKKAAELRHKQLDSKRQKLKADLEARERAAEERKKNVVKVDNRTPEEIFYMEIERLRKEGSRIVEEENELMRQQFAAMPVIPVWVSSEHRIKIKWKVDKDDPNNGGYTEENLRRFLFKYGDIVAFIMNPKKPGSALVEFNNQSGAEMAVQYEKGNLENPLTLKWIGEPPKKINIRATSNLITDRDFESVVLRNMRQAEERKRIIEQMMKEDEEEADNNS